MSAGTIWTLVVGGLAVAYVFGLWNGLIRARNNADKAFADIDVVLQQRHDELGKLVDACRQFMHHEKHLLEELTRLRTRYTQATDPNVKVAAAREIDTASRALHVAVEQYPTLRSSDNVLQLQSRISEVESTIADRREFFNESVTVYNTQIGRMPDTIVARLGGFAPRQLLAIAAEKKEDVKISLSG